ncbi:pyridoxal-phosphate dependent enzyme [Proteinivorax hydrogeniformans]|uniref:Pyridoxal-phosphate dependent enzyme n=1 Tax=Proteinivorax hydrogeniformans TaxID=1826727 RepID=A0AAU8HRD8_9FIRM
MSEENILKSRVGKTPLIRAKKLEEELGISKIYLKLEGGNPSGHREDRLAYLIIKDALDFGKDTICFGSFYGLGNSLAYLCQYYDINLVFVLPKKSKATKKAVLNQPNIKIIEHGKNITESVEHSNKLAEENNWYNANPGVENNVLNMSALSYIASELSTQAKEPITSVFSQMSYGFSVSGLHLGFRQLWIHDQIKKMPQLYSCTTDTGNIILQTYQEGSDKIDLKGQEKIKTSRYNRHLVNLNSSVAQDALNAIYDTNGKMMGVSDEELVEYVSMFKKLEKIKLNTANGFPIAGFIKQAKEGKIDDGVHVILLNDGKANVEIDSVTKEEKDISNDKVVGLINDWLMEFTDPKEEIYEALDNALDKGHLLFAYHNKDLAGIAIIVGTGFEHFSAKYHLAYIATKRTIKGRGIATQLLTKAVEVTDGNLSLHVEKNNKKAIKLYEKMGFDAPYTRMLHKAKGK